jgi:hypothetical protein
MLPSLGCGADPDPCAVLNPDSGGVRATAVRWQGPASREEMIEGARSRPLGAQKHPRMVGNCCVAASVQYAMA